MSRFLVSFGKLVRFSSEEGVYFFFWARFARRELSFLKKIKAPAAPNIGIRQASPPLFSFFLKMGAAVRLTPWRFLQEWGRHSDALGQLLKLLGPQGRGGAREAEASLIAARARPSAKHFAHATRAPLRTATTATTESTFSILLGSQGAPFFLRALRARGDFFLISKKSSREYSVVLGQGDVPISGFFWEAGSLFF